MKQFFASVFGQDFLFLLTFFLLDTTISKFIYLCLHSGNLAGACGVLSILQLLANQGSFFESSMFEIYASAIIWDGMGKISSYLFLSRIPYDENGMILGAGVLAIRAARRILSKIAPNSFNDVEIALISQIIGLLGLDGLILTCIKFGFHMEYPPWHVNRSILYQFHLSLIFGMLLICYAFTLTRSTAVNLGWSQLTHFFTVAFLVIVFLISPWMYLDSWQNPFIWVFEFILEKDRIFWVIYMGLMVCIGVGISTSLGNKVSLNLRRKPQLMHLAYSVSLSALICIEFIRVFEVEPVHKQLNSYMISFTTKQRDSGPIILSHFYLLIGCALPLWVCSIANINHWAAFSGIISIGIGDSIASIAGQNIGKNMWPGQSRTIEGSLSYLISVLLSFHILFYFFDMSLSASEMLKIFMLSLGSSALEAFAIGNDNLLLPIFLTTGFLSIE